jgi:hypothetical protein
MRVHVFAPHAAAALAPTDAHATLLGKRTHASDGPNDPRRPAGWPDAKRVPQPPPS